MDPIQTVKAKDSRTLMVNFSLTTGATHYIIRVQNANGFFREDTVHSSPAEIQSLAPYTEYTLSIMAVNGGSRGQPSLPVTAKTGRIVCHFSEKNNTQGLILVKTKVTLTENLISSLLMAGRSHLIYITVP